MKSLSGNEIKTKSITHLFFISQKKYAMDTEFTVSDVPVRPELVSTKAVQHSNIGGALSFLKQNPRQ